MESQPSQQPGLQKRSQELPPTRQLPFATNKDKAVEKSRQPTEGPTVANGDDSETSDDEL